MKDIKELARRIVEHCGNHPSILLEDKSTIVNEIIPEIEHHLHKPTNPVDEPKPSAEEVIEWLEDVKNSLIDLDVESCRYGDLRKTNEEKLDEAIKRLNQEYEIEFLKSALTDKEQLIDFHDWCVDNVDLSNRDEATEMRVERYFKSQKKPNPPKVK